MAMREPESSGPPVTRREFVAASATVLASSGLIPMVVQTAGSAQAPARAVDDGSVQHGPAEFRSGDETIDGYLARPKRDGTFPGIVVIPGVDGDLNPLESGGVRH